MLAPGTASCSYLDNDVVRKRIGPPGLWLWQADSRPSRAAKSLDFRECQTLLLFSLNLSKVRQVLSSIESAAAAPGRPFQETARDVVADGALGESRFGGKSIEAELAVRQPLGRIVFGLFHGGEDWSTLNSHCQVLSILRREVNRVF